MPRKPKIWKTEAEILRAIDNAKAFAMKKAHEAEEEAADARKFAKNGHEGSCCEAIKRRDAAFRSYRRTIDKRIPHLSEVLAAFRTRTMKEVMGDYEGVSVP